MFEARYSQTFNERLAEPRFTSLLTTIMRKAEMVMQLPYGAANSHKLRYDWTRKRSAHVDDRYRLIYKVCEECRKRSEAEPNHMINCLPCEGVPSETVNFLDIVDYHAVG
jgi:mRNA-degrading endonuclease YafQ of YafQ-DinJ toxin-antitoxin module